MNHLEKSILDIIEKHYERVYTGGIKVTKLLSGYRLILDLGIPDKRTIQIFIKQELISRQLEKVQFFRGVINYPEENDERCTYQ